MKESTIHLVYTRTEFIKELTVKAEIHADGGNTTTIIDLLVRNETDMIKDIKYQVEKHYSI